MTDITTYVQERLGSVATEEDADAVIQLALDLWGEQIERGLGGSGESAAKARLVDWLSNRTYPWTDLYDAAVGDVSALARVRAEAGLPVLS